MQFRSVGVGVGGVVVLLGCAGLPGAVGDPSGPVALDSPVLMTLTPTDDGCRWERHSPSTGASALLWESAGACPGEVIWHPDGARIVTVDEEGVWTRPWLGDGAPEVVPLPEVDGERRGPWISPDGLRVAYLLEATVERDGKRRVFTAGDRSAPTWPDEGNAVTYGVRGTDVVSPGIGDRDVWLPPWGLDALAVFFDREPDGTWRETAALPTRFAAGDTPALDVGGDLNERAGAPSWTALRTTCASGPDCYAPDGWEERDDIVSALGLEDGDGPGFLAGGEGGWLFTVAFGDSPHGFGPVLWCADPGCADRTPLEDLPDGQLSLDVRGDLLLVAEEYSNAGPVVYRAGEATPVGRWPDALAGAWLPDDSLPGVPESPLPTR